MINSELIFKQIRKKMPNFLTSYIEEQFVKPEVSIALDEISDCLYRCCVDENRKRPVIHIKDEDISSQKIWDKLNGTFDETSALAERIQNQLKFQKPHMLKFFGWSSAVSVLLFSGSRVFVVKIKKDGLASAKFEVEKISNGE